jgi:hypothetical protein
MFVFSLNEIFFNWTFFPNKKNIVIVVNKTPTLQKYELSDLFEAEILK